ncbi:hypothetical protein RUND412_004764 [Rhizina undulata]
MSDIRWQKVPLLWLLGVRFFSELCLLPASLGIVIYVDGLTRVASSEPVTAVATSISILNTFTQLFFFYTRRLEPLAVMITNSVFLAVWFAISIYQGSLFTQKSCNDTLASEDEELGLDCQLQQMGLAGAVFIAAMYAVLAIHAGVVWGRSRKCSMRSYHEGETGSTRKERRMDKPEELQNLIFVNEEQETEV